MSFMTERGWALQDSHANLIGYDAANNEYIVCTQPTNGIALFDKEEAAKTEASFLNTIVFTGAPIKVVYVEITVNLLETGQ